MYQEARLGALSRRRRERIAPPPMKGELPIMSIALDARSATGSTSRRGIRSAVLLDSHPLLLEIVERVLEAAGVTTVSKQTTAEEALDAVREHRPDLFLLDLRNAGGVESIQEARQLVPGLKTIVLADTADDAMLAAAFAAGTTVAISRSASPDDLALAARQAFEPSIFLAHTERAAPAPHSAGSARRSAHEAGARDPVPRRRGIHERPGRQAPVGDRADGQVPPLQHLPEARCGEPDRGQPLGAAPRPARRGARRRMSEAKRVYQAGRSRLIQGEGTRGEAGGPASP